MAVAELVHELLGSDQRVGVRAFDGSQVDPPGSVATVVLSSPGALRRVVTAPGELGFSRAYVAGDLDVEGDLYAALELARRLRGRAVPPRRWAAIVEVVGVRGLRPLPPPPEEVRLRGRRHSKGRDAAAVGHHYDLSDHFYRLVLGPTMTYSCGLWPDPHIGVDAAQEAKHELVCQKLGLRPGMRLLDVGCGWGSLVLHAACHHGVSAVGVTLSGPQAEWAKARVADAGVTHLVEIRQQDYRDVHDGPFDAISSVGMFEHVGASRLGLYFRRLSGLLPAGGRLLNHGIARPPFERARFAPRGFVNRYVFPDAELHEVGAVVSEVQKAGLEVRHVENLREHYALTLRAWVANLEGSWDEAVAEVGAARARIARLYMAGAALNFEANGLQVHQVLAVRSVGGRSDFPLRGWKRPQATSPGQPTGSGRLASG